MNKKNIKKLLLLTTMLGITGTAYSQSSYICMPCPDGQWSDGTTGECTDDIESLNLKFKDTPFKKLEKAETGTLYLTQGCYKINIIGGGGGGGGGNMSGGGGGGSGYRETEYLCYQNAFTVAYTVGSGGSGGNSRGSGYFITDGNNGNPSSIKVTNKENGVIANGGDGGDAGQFWDNPYISGGKGYQNGSPGNQFQGGAGGGPNGGAAGTDWGGGGATGCGGGGGGGGGDNKGDDPGGNGFSGCIYIYKQI